MKKLSVLFAAVMMFVSFGVAKAQKTATLDVMSILNVMPEKKKADADLKTFLDAKQAEIKKKAEAGQAKMKLYSEEAPKKTAAENQAREQELGKMQEEIAQMQDKAQKDFITKQEAAYTPIQKKIDDAVAKVAKANTIDFVLDGNSTTFIYKNGPDITADVKKELGLK